MRGHIYKLSIGDDFYIGSTSSYYVCNRWAGHKHDCDDPKRKQHNYPLYKRIRELGGWDKVKRECLWTGETDNLRKLEDDYVNELKPTLNITRPYETEEQRKERRSKQMKIYYIREREAIDKRRGVGISIECECGGSYVKCQKYKHLRSGRHKHFVETGEKVKHRVHNNLVDKNKKVVECECGGRYSHYGRNGHFKTKIHQDFVNSNC